MLKSLTLTLALTFTLSSTVDVGQALDQKRGLKSVYDEQKDLTTISLPTLRISGDRDRYHSIDFSLSYDYKGKSKRSPQNVRFELTTVVKAQRLDTDLNVLFLLDGIEHHYGSNRSAILKPVPGRLWIGERMVFLIPYTDFQKFSHAEKIEIKLGNVLFELGPEPRDAIRKFASL